MRTLLAAVYAHAEATPFKPAIVLLRGGCWTQLSYLDLMEETERWARIWRAHCSTEGAVVFIVLPHRIELYPALLGAMRAGLIPSFLPFPTSKQDPALYWANHEALFARVQPACILTYKELIAGLEGIRSSETCLLLDVDHQSEPDCAADLPPLPDAINPERIALLQHSSGTTGLKKGVELTFRQIREQVEACARAIKADGGDRIASWLPLYHDMGLVSSFLMPMTLGAMVASLDAFEWLTQPDALLTEIARFRCTFCWLPNFAFNHLVRTRDRDTRYDLSSVRAFINCSEPCKSETFEQFQRAFGKDGLKEGALQVCYGMAEAVFAVTHTAIGTPPKVLHVDRARFARSEILQVEPNDPDGLALLSCGKPVDGVRLRIVAEAKKPSKLAWPRGFLSFGKSPPVDGDLVVGEIQVGGSFVFSGYFRNPEATSQGFEGEWFRTGDMGFLHEGELYVCGRIKEMLIVHGRNFYANDIEDIVNRVAGVKPGRVVALGLHDSVTASEEAVVIAETTLPEGAERNALTTAIREEVYKALSLSVKRVEIADVGTLIKTTSGKISRDENRKRFSEKVSA